DSPRPPQPPLARSRGCPVNYAAVSLMAVRSLRLFPDPLLNRSSVEVSKFDSDLRELIEDLIDTMKAGPGVGLAAPQIGVLKKVSVIEVGRRSRSKTRQKGTNHGQLIL